MASFNYEIANILLHYHSFFENRRKQQEKYLSEIKERFKKPMLFIPLLDREPKGLETLRKLGQEICIVPDPGKRKGKKDNREKRSYGR